MFSKTVFSGDNNNEACQHWTNFEKYITTQSKHNTLASHDELCEAFLVIYQEELIIGFKPLDIILQTLMIYKSPS